jgi:hypothetical protein
MTPNNLNELISLKGAEWETILLNAREVIPDKFLSDKSLIRLALNSDSTEEFSTLIKCLYQDLKERPVGIAGIDYFFKAVNYSNYSLKDWIKVVHHFNLWLLNEKRQSPFLKQLGYLQCCEESPENKDISQPLIKLVDEMLSQYGFVG